MGAPRRLRSGGTGRRGRRCSPAQNRRSSGQRLVEASGPVGALHAEGLLLAGVHGAEPEGGEQAAPRETVEGGQLLGEQHRVAPGKDQHGEAELDPVGEAGRDAEATIGSGQSPVTRSDSQSESKRSRSRAVTSAEKRSGSRRGTRAEPVPDAHLHESQPATPSGASPDGASPEVLAGTTVAAMSTIDLTDPVPTRWPSRRGHGRLERPG